ncbi:exonuclease, putative [Eimeria mitis]|uniref:Exonuclease 1 n=1 Tax=Eimeria mitis TaxID=44415 RepID=U6K3Y0_9EIME|nr:exonuclease, putative [Eimeria mitis]CDJ30463.1 exonuclease, putative [Eimeria mitis]
MQLREAGQAGNGVYIIAEASGNAEQAAGHSRSAVDKVIAACRELGIRCIVAPFEADAQLAYLSRTNQIHSAISEDSDLLAYGCKRVMLKMDKEGKCEVLRLPFLQDENDNFLSEPQIHHNKTSKQTDKEEVVAGHLEAERTFMNHKVFDPRTQRVVLIRSHATQGQRSDIDASFEDVDERAIAIATGVIDPRTGAARNTALSPAECALIRDCQEKAFCGLEARQLRAEIASKIEETRSKLVTGETPKETTDIVSSDTLNGTEEHKTERHIKKATGITVRLAMRAPTGACVAIEAPTQQKKENKLTICPPEDVLNALDAFVAPTALSRNSKEATATANAVDSDERIKVAKRLLQDMKDESLKLIGAAPALAEVPTNVMPATTSATPAAVAEAATAEPDPGCGDVTVSLTGAECSSRQSYRSSSLLQFASATKRSRHQDTLCSPHEARFYCRMLRPSILFS